MLRAEAEKTAERIAELFTHSGRQMSAVIFVLMDFGHEAEKRGMLRAAELAESFAMAAHAGSTKSAQDEGCGADAVAERIRACADDVE